MFLTEGWTFWVLPFTYFYIPQSARAHLFSQSVKVHYFCRGPLSVDPICPQPTAVGTAGSFAALWQAAGSAGVFKTPWGFAIQEVRVQAFESRHCAQRAREPMVEAVVRALARTR